MKKFKINPSKKYVFIMGAGASKDDNLPIQNEILQNILKRKFAMRNRQGLHKNEYKKVSDGIKKLLKSVFNSDVPLENISLEAIFNILETSISQGHNIGLLKHEEIKKYYDMLIEGIMFATLTDAKLKEHNVFNKNPYSPYTVIGKKIFENYKNTDINFSFITFNYDICLDRVLLSMYNEDENKTYDVDFGIELGNYDLQDWFHRPRKRKIYLLRPHGSINWLFCKTCGKVFSRISQQGNPIELVDGIKCYHCGSATLEPYIVHPANNRTYVNKYIAQVWDKMENVLAEADYWCFIGYSLPEADRYFTYMLSRIYNFRKIKTLKNNRVPEVSVVNVNKSANFHGEMISKADTCYNDKCKNADEIRKYFEFLQKDKDVFRRFEVYFSNIKKYECSFREFATKYFSV
ncbi:MAG: hypothetical protein PHI20_01990 [Endomicrobiaceae bacterium]|jgi:NAD-dependent SIR2 family protein deacetylase|nr:hypothetical protein [Endomicrobiaceae bacterium]MDD3729787.1 hypothetical protein [Endomicrobiaceae bacterium]MDD4166354.1 hypothetical protein [Endomicrobiaceae bacterium]